MRFAPSILALVVGAQATLVQRDLLEVQKALGDIKTATDSLDVAVQGYSGDPTALGAATEKLLSIIKTGTSTISAMEPLTIVEASQVAQGVTGLNSSVTSVINDLISKKPTFVSAGFSGMILKSIQDQRTASKAFSDTLTSKIPSDLQPLAKQLSQGIDDSLASGIAAFSGTGGSGPSPSSSAAYSSSVAPSASAATASAAKSPAPSAAPYGASNSTSGSASSSGYLPKSSASSAYKPASSVASASSKASASPSSKAATTNGGAATSGYLSGAFAAMAVVLAF